MKPYDLGIDLDTFDASKAITLDAARQLVRGRKGQATIETLRRWVNPRLGCRPRGEDGPLLVLPAVFSCRTYWTMPVWVERFEQARRRLSTREVKVVAYRTPLQRQRAHERAEARLDTRGVC